MSIVFPSIEVEDTIYGTGVTALASVVVATTTNGTLASDFEAGDLVDGVSLVAGDRILLKDQSSSVENGVYVVQASGAPIRAEDFDTGSSVASVMVRVDEGTTNANTGWVCTNNRGNDVVGTDGIAFQQFSGTGVDGDLNGPASATDTAIARFDGTTGALLQNSGVLIDGSDNLTGAGNIQLSGNLLDVNSNELINFVGAVNAVNQVEIENSATGVAPIIRASGDDTNVDIAFESKGTGVFTFAGGGSGHSGQIRLLDDTGGQYVALRSAPTVSSSYILTLPDAVPSTGEVLRASDNSGNLEFASVSSIFGSEWEEAGPSDPFINTGTNFVAVLLFTTASKPIGTYRIGWYYEWALDASNRDFLAEVTLDGTPIATQQQEPSESGGSSNIPGSGTDQRFNACGFHYETFGSASTHTILIRIASGQNGVAAAIDNARLEIWRVA